MAGHKVHFKEISKWVRTLRTLCKHFMDLFSDFIYSDGRELRWLARWWCTRSTTWSFYSYTSAVCDTAVDQAKMVVANPFFSRRATANCVSDIASISCIDGAWFVPMHANMETKWKPVHVASRIIKRSGGSRFLWPSKYKRVLTECVQDFNYLFDIKLERVRKPGKTCREVRRKHEV